MRMFVGAAERTGKLTAFEPKVTPAGHILRYCPDGIINDGNVKPLFLVYGDEGFTEQSATAALAQYGLAELAADANCNILFMSPVAGEWGAADVELYVQVYNSIVHSFGGENGLKEAINFRTRESEGLRIVASEQMIYVLANGRGADFVAKYLVGDGLTRESNDGMRYYHPAGIMLSNTDTMPQLGALGMPAYIVNGTAAQAEAFKASLEVEREGTHLVVEAASEVKDDFDPAQIMAAWQQVFFHVRRKDDGSGAELFVLPEYEDFILEDKTIEISTGAIRYLLFIPKAFDMTQTAAYPLMMGFHGGGDDALFHAWCSEWPLIGQKEGFIVVEVDQHGPRSAADMVEVLQHLLKEYPAIDAGKVYGSGFSMGAGKSWNCGMGEWGVHFAGIGPTDGAGRPESADITELNGMPIDFDHILPTIYVAGDLDNLGVGPNQKMPDGSIFTGCNNMMNVLFRKNGTAPYTFDPAGDYYWGLTDEPEITKDRRMTAYTHHVANPDGKVYAAFCNVAGQSHAQMGIAARAVWNFLKQFRRLPDGSIVIE